MLSLGDQTALKCTDFSANFECPWCRCAIGSMPSTRHGTNTLTKPLV